MWEQRLGAGGTLQVGNMLQRCGIKERLADALCSELHISGKRLCDLKKQERLSLLEMLIGYPIQVRTAGPGSAADYASRSTPSELKSNHEHFVYYLHLASP